MKKFFLIVVIAALLSSCATESSITAPAGDGFNAEGKAKETAQGASYVIAGARVEVTVEAASDADAAVVLERVDTAIRGMLIED